MNNVIYKIAKRNLKQNKRKYYLLFSILIVTMLLIGVTTYVDSLILEREKENKEIYGSFYYVIEEIDQKTYDELISNPYVNESNQMHIYGHFDKNTIGYCDSLTLLPANLISGRLPTKDNEIVLEKQVLDSMGITHNLNQEIKLTYTLLNNEQITKTYILCGVMETSADLYTDHLDAITTKTDNETKNALYYTTKNAESFVDSYLLFENSKVIPSMLGQTSESFYAQNTLMNIISIVGIVLIMYSLNLIAQDITKELTLLRMMGSSKGQVALLFFYQIFMISIIAIPCGFLIGILLSFIATLLYNLNFVVKLSRLLYVFVVLLMSLFIGSALPIITATQASLGRSMRLNRNVKKVKQMKKIRTFGLVKRTIRFKKMSVILFGIFASICLCLITNCLITIQTILFDLNEPQKQTHITISCDDITKRMDIKVLDELSLHPALGNHSITTIEGDEYFTYEVNFGFENIYQANKVEWNSRTEAIGRIKTASQPKYEKYLNENQFMIYLPTIFVKITGAEDRIDGILSVNRDRPFGYESYDIKVEENRIHVGDKIYINGDEVEVSYILTYEEMCEVEGIPIHKVPYDPYTYTILVSEAFAKAHNLNYGFNTATFDVKEGYDLDYLKSDVYKIVHEYYDLSFTVSHDYQEPTNLISEIIVQCFYVTSLAIVIILLLTQQLRTQFERRGQDISLYQLIGMNRGQVIRLYLFEGMLVSITVIILSFIGTFAKQIMELIVYVVKQVNSLINYGSLLDFDFFYSIPKDVIPIYVIVHVIFALIVLSIYYINAKHVLEIDKMDRLRQII